MNYNDKVGEKMDVAKIIRKYFIMGSQNCRRNPEVILQEAIEGGITAFQFREKGEGALTGNAKIELGKRLRAICRHHNVPFFINDDIELINILEVDGIHVGQDDTPIKHLRKLYPDLLIGLSISNETELKNSDLDDIDYVGAGPIFTTSTKVDAKQAVGTKWIRLLRNRYPNLPIVGIGGINQSNAHEVMDAGANGLAFISVVTYATNIKQTLRNL